MLSCRNARGRSYRRELGFAVLLPLLASAAPAESWKPLWNGTDLTGWHKVGGEATYSIEGDEIVGTVKKTAKNTFLATDQSYEDFILELEFKVDGQSNSGIQVRSAARPPEKGGSAFGYQVEIDPSPRAWTGGIYDEARRGWLVPLEANDPARSAYRAGEWNTFRIECIGHHIRTWLNDVPAAHLIDDMTSSGFIALQVHAPYGDVVEIGQTVRWRNLRIQTEALEPREDSTPHVVNTIANLLTDAETSLGWKSLFDGTSFDGWRFVHSEDSPSGRWSVADGALTIGSTEGRAGDIVTEESFGAFELQLEFRLTEAANSGIKYPVTESYQPGSRGAIGLEFQLLDDRRHPDAKTERGDLRKLGALYDLIEAQKEGRFVRRTGDWNHARIVARADGSTEHWLNHRKVLEFNRLSAEFDALVAGSKYKDFDGFGRWPDGRLLLQDHGDRVDFRSIKVRRLD